MAGVCEQFAAVGFCLESNWTLGCWRGCEQFAAVGFVENPSGLWAAGEVVNTCSSRGLCNIRLDFGLLGELRTVCSSRVL